MFLNINIKTIFRICFYLILIAVCISSWIKLLRVPTAFEEKVVYNQAILPSFTLCPREVDDTNRNELIESFEYIDKAIKNVRYRYTIQYEEYKAYEEIKVAEINYTDTSYGVWYFVPKISMMSPFEAVICLIWTPSREYKLKSDWGLRFTTYMDSSQSPYYVLQFHEENNSPYLYKFPLDQRFWIESNTSLSMGLEKQIDTINMNKPNYTCNENNSNIFMHCMEKYYSRKLGCILPWVLKKNINVDSMNLCEGKVKFKEFKNISMNILRTEETKELINEGCFVPNCMQRSWTLMKNQRREKIINDKVTTGFQYFAEEIKVLVRKEVNLYTMINFFAEVGGYLGLLLGESLISYIITTTKWFQSLRRKFKERCRKADEEPESTQA